ncbi:sensor histidine kinase [Azospirillum sp. A39]|uniref:sensor histidine kinase n=1 Tax=Azospirillum sp. A39 TaxID=3462279 RepID=UPI004046407A
MRVSIVAGLVAALALAGFALSVPTAAAAVVVSEASEVVPLAPVLDVAFDPGGALTLDDVAAERGGGVPFRPLTAGPRSFGQTTGAVWGRVRLDLTHAAAADRWLLAIDTLLVGRADLFLVAEDGRVLMHEARGLSLATTPTGEVQFTAALTPHVGRTATLYMRAQSRFTLVLAPVLRTTLAQVRHEAEITRMQAPLNGSIASMLLLFGAHWLLLRSRLYAYAFGAALGVALTSFFGSGLNRVYGVTWPDNADWWIIEGAGIVALHCLPMFVANYLDLEGRRPTMYRRLRGAVAAMTAINVAFMLLLPHRLLTALTVSFFAVSAVALWLVAFQRGVGSRERWSLVLAVGPFLALNSLHLVAFNRWAPELLPWRGWVPQLFTIGLSMLLFGFALAVADQIRFRLATLVEQRTKQLVAANARTEEALVAEQAARQRLRQFIRMAAHEFKTPLAVIDGAAQVLPLLIGTPSSDAQRRLDNIRANVRRLLGLIEACFAEDRLDERGLVLRVEPFSPVAMIEDVAQHHRLLHARTIRVHTAAPAPVVHGDRDLLRMVFNAVLDNAAKYSPPTSAVDVDVAMSDAMLEVRILDRGCGVPAAERENLGTRYFRASNVASVPGTGLGLYLARSIVARHGGRLSFADREGGGTVFTIALPVGGQAPAADAGSAAMKG